MNADDTHRFSLRITKGSIRPHIAFIDCTGPHLDGQASEDSNHLMLNEAGERTSRNTFKYCIHRHLIFVYLLFRMKVEPEMRWPAACLSVPGF